MPIEMIYAAPQEFLMPILPLDHPALDIGEDRGTPILEDDADRIRSNLTDRSPTSLLI
jgi:hypothetical protein